jgi:hypothetical protein
MLLRAPGWDVMRNFFRTLVPEQFDANIVVHSDGSYGYAYAGVLVFASALPLPGRGSMDARLEGQLKSAATQLRNEGFRKAEYLGSGRYSVALEGVGARGETSFFPSRETKLFSIRAHSDGAIEIAFRPDAAAQCQLAGADAAIDGRLSVILDRGVKVLSHNGKHRLATHGLPGGYEWTIKSPGADPFIIVQPAR